MAGPAGHHTPAPGLRAHRDPAGAWAALTVGTPTGALARIIPDSSRPGHQESDHASGGDARGARCVPLRRAGGVSGQIGSSWCGVRWFGKVCPVLLRAWRERRRLSEKPATQSWRSWPRDGGARVGLARAVDRPRPCGLGGHACRCETPRREGALSCDVRRCLHAQSILHCSSRVHCCRSPQRGGTLRSGSINVSREVCAAVLFGRAGLWGERGYGSHYVAGSSFEDTHAHIHIHSQRFIRTHTHVHACFHACAHTCTHSHTRTFTKDTPSNTSTHIDTDTSTSARKHSHARAHTCACVHTCSHMYTFTHVHTCIHVYTHVHTCARLRSCTRMYTCTHVDTYRHAHTLICIRVSSHTCIRIHICIQS